MRQTTVAASSAGMLISPPIESGIGKLSFNYGTAYTESNGLSMRVDVKQNGKVVKSFTVTRADATKHTVYNFDEDVNVSGTFTIEFTNLSPSAPSANKDRVAIWNVNWTQSR